MALNMPFKVGVYPDLLVSVRAFPEVLKTVLNQVHSNTFKQCVMSQSYGYPHLVLHALA